MVSPKLVAIKIVRTLIWIFFNLLIACMYDEVIANKIDKCLWISIAIIAMEGLALLMFDKQCPLTVLARKYSKSSKHNFDIYLPETLAKYHQLVYTALFTIVFLLVLRLMVNANF